jgi:protocatechuate 3,4-dioxygenase beta subunit
MKNDEITRKEALGVLGLTGVSLLIGCGGGGGDNTTSPTPTPSTTPTPGGNGTCVLIPSETQGPYPLLSILSNNAMNRANITEGRTGVPLTIKLKVVNVGSSCGPITSGYVYIWHTDKDGNYSGYGSYVGQTFMRGYLPIDSNGEVAFTTVYPGWYPGRITHVHFQVYVNGVSSTVTATSQMAFPQDITQTVYASPLYSAKGQNTSVTSFAQDNVFRDGTTYQMASATGSVAAGYVATLTVGINS